MVFINDLDKVTRFITIMNKFADDTKCGQVIRGQGDIATLQKCIDELIVRADTWGMSFNHTKCKVMHVGRVNPCAEYEMNGHVLDSTEFERDIGVKVHRSLRPSMQCNEASQLDLV